MSQITSFEKIIRLAISIIGFPLTTYQTIVSHHYMQNNKPTGQLVQIGERHLHALVTGEHNNNVTVILESGMGGMLTRLVTCTTRNI
ncbi:hypothetical protein J2Z32_000819 [Paenibacillus turicensis]|uniref:Uncharacterized protein n=1 Tax=Paenibacillus turicensis TaxID=160487 RepID=A0ABS4FNQ3_9BACL|nr:hypothetical protein [Paenibacillus turicensis]MBP1904202.1 hypothetical protein [Paenibacillus turicensis]